MRRYSIRYSLDDLKRQAAQETYNRASSFDKGVRETSPDLVQNIASLTRAYPTIPKEILPYVALSGTSAEDEIALSLANRAADIIAKKNTENLVTDVNFLKRGVQMGFLGLDAVFQNVSRGFKSAVVAAQETGKFVPGVVANATLGGLYETLRPQAEGEEGSSTARYLNNIYGGGVGDVFKQTRDRYGKNEFRLALEQSRKGKPLNLGTGFLPNSLDPKETQVYLDMRRAGKTEKEALSRAVEVYGLPVTQLYDKREDAFQYEAKDGTKVNISPGRIAAVQMFEPGSTGFSVVSGVIDGVFRLAGDPTNLALMYGAGVKTAMRTMVQANKQSKNASTLFKSFVPGKTGKFNRAAFYGRTVDDVRSTGWGQKFGEAIAKLKGDEGRAFLDDIKEFDNVPASVKEVLLHVDDADDVWNILDIVAKNGNLTGKEFDNMFNLIKKYVNDDVAANLDRVREASVENIAFGLNSIPARPTAMGELFNYANKLMIGKSTDVAPMRKFAGLLLSKDDPARGLLGTGTQIARSQYFPRHVKRAMQLRPETIMVIDDLEAASRNANDMLKLSFSSAKERGYYSRLVLTATSQKELEDIAYQINQAIAKNVSDYNPNLKIDVEDIMKQQESYNAQMNELRDFFGNSAGGSIAFNGTQIKKRYKKLIKDIEEHFKATGIEVNPDDVEKYIFEAVPSMHLLSQASKSYMAQLIDPRDVIQATRAHQTLIAPTEKRLTTLFDNLNIFNENAADMKWADRLKIPRKAFVGGYSSNRLTLKPKTMLDTFLDETQNKILKPAWMFRLALLMRIAPEEAARAAFGGYVNAWSHPLQRLAMVSNKYLNFVGDVKREDKIFQLRNNLDEIVFSSNMGPDDYKKLAEMIDEKTLKNFLAIEYPQVEKILKSYLLETSYTGQVSDYMINAAINNVNLKTFVREAVQESKLSIGSKQINAKAKGTVVGFDKKTEYASMGEALVEGGGFSIDLDAAKFLDMKKRVPSDAEVFVSPYKEFEFPLGTAAEVQEKAAKVNMTPIEWVDSQIDNLFFTDETISHLSKDGHVLGAYIDDDGILMLDVSVGLSGENAIDNAIFMGINAFQESIYVGQSGRQAATQAGYGNVMTSEGFINLYRKKAKDGEILTGGAAAINYDSVIAKEVLEVLYKNNFDALSLTMDDVKGAGRGLPNGSLFSADEGYRAAMGEQNITEGLIGGRKELVENLFIRTDKRLPNDNINPYYWEGLWTEIGEVLAPDPITVRLLNLGIDDMMEYLRTNPTGKNLIKEFVERSHNADDIAFLTDDAALRSYLESIEYRVGIAVGNPTAKMRHPIAGYELSPQNTSQVYWVNKQKVYPKFEVDLSVTANTKLFQFIKSGGFLEGKDWVRWKSHINTLSRKKRGKANQDFYQEFIKVFTKEVDGADLGPQTIPRRFDLKNRINNDGTIIAGEEIVAAGAMDDLAFSEGMASYDRLLETGYNTLISKPSNWLNRDPLFRRSFYTTAVEVMAYMDDATTAEFMKGAKVWIEGTNMWDDLLKASKQPKIENTITSLEQAETLLKHKAMEDVKNLFYSTSQRHVASDLFSKYIPFPEIWAEVFKTWGGLIVDNPHKFNATRIAVDNGAGATPWDSENGFLSEDPRTGKLMFNYVDAFNVITFGAFKGLGKVAEMSGLRDALPDIVTSPYQTTVFGEDLQDEGVRVAAPGFAAGLNLVAQNGFAPGFGPAVQIPMKYFIDKFGSTKAFRKFFLGEYESSGQLKDIAQPAWLKKFRLFLSGENIADKDMQRTFASTAMDLYTAYVLAGIVDQSDPQSVREGVERATEQAKAVFGFRAAAQFALPTAVQPRIEVEDKNGQWWGVQTLVNKYQEMLIKNGYDHFTTQQEFITKFGVNPIPLKQPGSYRVGKQPIKENSFIWWQKDENKELLRQNNLPNTAYYIYPDKIEDELFYPAYYETRAQNITTGEFATFMRHTQAIFEYEKGKADIRDNGKTTTEQNKEISDLKNQINDEYQIDMFNFQGKPNSVTTTELMYELRRWNDFEQTKNSPENKYVQEYLDNRDELIDVILNGGTFTFNDLTIEVENRDGKIYYTYEEEDEYGMQKSVTKRSQKKARTLNGTSQIMIDARVIMKAIWDDMIVKGKDTNFPQLANEVLFYEISPTNSQNESS